MSIVVEMNTHLGKAKIYKNPLSPFYVIQKIAGRVRILSSVGKDDLRWLDVSMDDPMPMDCRKSSEQGSEIHFDITRSHLAVKHLPILRPMVYYSSCLDSL